MLAAFFKTRDHLAPLVLRIFLVMVFFPHGAQKVFGWWGGGGFSGTMQSFTQNMNIPAPFAFLAILAEFGGSICLLLGLLTRLSAFGIFSVMLVATLMVHLDHGFFMNWQGNQKGEGFEYHLLAMAIALALMISGGGKWSLDNLIGKKLSRKREP